MPDTPHPVTRSRAPRLPWIARVRYASGRIDDITVHASSQADARRQAEKRSGVDYVISLTQPLDT